MKRGKFGRKNWDVKAWDKIFDRMVKMVNGGSVNGTFFKRIRRKSNERNSSN